MPTHVKKENNMDTNGFVFEKLEAQLSEGVKVAENIAHQIKELSTQSRKILLGWGFEVLVAFASGALLFVACLMLLFTKVDRPTCSIVALLGLSLLTYLSYSLKKNEPTRTTELEKIRATQKTLQDEFENQLYICSLLNNRLEKQRGDHLDTF